VDKNSFEPADKISASNVYYDQITHSKPVPALVGFANPQSYAQFFDVRCPVYEYGRCTLLRMFPESS
jgi:hypothetical protein